MIRFAFSIQDHLYLSLFHLLVKVHFHVFVLTEVRFVEMRMNVTAGLGLRKHDMQL